jgi:Ca2+-transporting ATPase
VDTAAGLSEGEVERRRRESGPNLIPTRELVSDARLIARQFASLVVALLSVATAVSFVFGGWRQATAVVVVLVINAAIGYCNEQRAVRSMDALRALGGRNARVRRAGRSDVGARDRRDRRRGMGADSWVQLCAPDCRADLDRC